MVSIKIFVVVIFVQLSNLKYSWLFKNANEADLKKWIQFF